MVKSARSVSGPLGDPPIDESQFRAWLAALASPRVRRGPDALGHARGFFRALGDPQNRVRAVHIVGTAGKGTVAHMVTNRLVAGGHTVATHMSPHVYDPRERFLIDGEMPDWSEVIVAAHEVHDAVEQTRLSTGYAPSYFAVTAALSWVMGRTFDTEFLVIEAGVGGRHDATNVIDRPDRLVVVTAVGLDHTDALGSTVREIAAAKVAVFTGCSAVVMAPQTDSVATEVAVKAARAAGVKLVVPVVSSGDWRVDCDATAAAVESVITGRSSSSTTLQGLPPGRLETIEAGGRVFVLDGAHSPIKLGGLADSLALDWPGKVRCVIAAIGRSKDLHACAHVLARIAPMVVATSFDTDPGGSGRFPRSWPVAELATAVSRVSPLAQVCTADDPREAVEVAVRKTGRGEVVVITGSFMYLAAARRAVRELPLS